MSLNEDIDNLDSLLKFINIFLIPIILTILLLVFHFLKKKSRSNEKLMVYLRL
ncbi:MAG: hypothetical protein CM15mP93_14700 [Thiotrichaceae bacterium]|nr:MAG: hypothetical protein CM15mP93_14700 [Thiotrichaceae bacterium]